MQLMERELRLISVEESGELYAVLELARNHFNDLVELKDFFVEALGKLSLVRPDILQPVLTRELEKDCFFAYDSVSRQHTFLQPHIHSSTFSTNHIRKMLFPLVFGVLCFARLVPPIPMTDRWSTKAHAAILSIHPYEPCYTALLKWTIHHMDDILHEPIVPYPQKLLGSSSSASLGDIFGDADLWNSKYSLQ